MNILYLCHRFPYPPKRGGKIRPFNMIRHLHDAGHRVTVCSLARSEAEAQEGAGIAPHCTEFHMGHVREPMQFARVIGRVGLSFKSGAADGLRESPAVRFGRAANRQGHAAAVLATRGGTP